MERTPISVALPLAERIVAHMLELPGVTHASICGSLRRFSETIGDVDIVVAAAAAEPVMEALVSMSLVDRVLGRGEAKTSVVTRRGTQIDLRVVAEKQLGAALLYFTGSKGHNIKLRQRALARGLTLNEYALSEIEGGRVVASETEEQIYEALGLPFIPPVLREDAGEIEAAEKGALPGAHAAGDRRLPRPHHRLGRRPLAARGGGRRREGPRLPGPRHHRPRRGDAVGRQPREAARTARALSGHASRARRFAAPAPRRRAEHRSQRRARLRPRVPPRVRLVPRLGARPLRARSRRADQAGRHGDARSGGADDRPPLGAHDRRPPADRSRHRRHRRPPPRRPAPRSR